MKKSIFFGQKGKNMGKVLRHAKFNIILEIVLF